MKIYLMEQNINNNFETCNNCVVVAKNKKEARRMHPSSYVTHIKNNHWMGNYIEEAGGGEYEIDEDFYGWVRFKDIDKIKITEIGVAYPSIEKGFITSFNG